MCFMQVMVRQAELQEAVVAGTWYMERQTGVALPNGRSLATVSILVDTAESCRRMQN
jgi:hypothetical protein